MFGNSHVTLGNVANLPIAGQRKTILRFVADKSGTVKTFHWCWRSGEYGWTAKIVNGRRTWNYSAGDGGRYHVELQGDNKGKPDGNVLSYFDFVVDLKNHPTTGPGGAKNTYRQNEFAVPANLVEGEAYNLVFTNTHDDPLKNYSSLNGVFSRDKKYDAPFEVNQITPRGFAKGSGTFAYFPQWAIHMDTGIIGFPFQYGDAWTDQNLIGGTNLVKQELVCDRDINLSILKICATRIQGDAPLTCIVQVGDQITTHHLSGFPRHKMGMRGDKPKLSGGMDFKSFDWVKVPVSIQASKGETVSMTLTSGGLYYVPASVRAGNYTKILADQLMTKGCAFASSDSGKTWRQWSVRPHRPVSSDGIILSIYGE